MIVLRVTGGEDPYAELVSLRAWLAAEGALRGRLTIDQPPVPSGQMGALSDVLVVAAGAGGAVTVLASSLSVWLKHRRADVTIEVRGEDGRSVTVTAGRVASAEAVIREVLSGRGTGGEA
jgi:hypothetical protein